LRRVRYFDPAHDVPATLLQFDGSCVAIVTDVLNAAHLPLGEKCKHTGPRERRSVSKRKGDGFLRPRVDVLSEPAWIQTVLLQKEVIEPPDASESSCQCHCADGQARVRQQALCQQQPLSLSELDQRYAIFGVENPAQMAVSHADTRGKLREARTIQKTFFYERRRRLGKPARHIEQSVTGRQLRPATQAGAKSGLLGRRGVGKEVTILPLRRPYGTDRPTIDACRSDADKKPTIESAISRKQCLVAGVGIEVHASTLVESRR
jgi:hypothetical protein